MTVTSALPILCMKCIPIQYFVSRNSNAERKAFLHMPVTQLFLFDLIYKNRNNNPYFTGLLKELNEDIYNIYALFSYMSVGLESWKASLN